MEDRQPQQARQVHHAPVGEEFREEAAHGGRRGRIRGAEVGEQDAGRGRHDATIPQKKRRPGEARPPS